MAQVEEYMKVMSISYMEEKGYTWSYEILAFSKKNVAKQTVNECS
jgi:hypothetical protein